MYEVQWQATGVDVTLVTTDLSFAPKIVEFIAKTRDNPEFRDIPLGDGRYRHVVTELELNESFVDTRVCIGKNGEFGCRYYVRICSGHLRLLLIIDGTQVDHLLGTLNEVVESYRIVGNDRTPEC
jgi:hypothetical protein